MFLEFSISTLFGPKMKKCSFTGFFLLFIGFFLAFADFFLAFTGFFLAFTGFFLRLPVSF